MVQIIKENYFLCKKIAMREWVVPASKVYDVKARQVGRNQKCSNRVC